MSQSTARSVLVTGGNRGIGRAIAQSFLEAGDSVAVTSRSGDAPEGAMAVAAELTDPASLLAAYDQVEAAQGPVEILIANAGVTRDGLLLRMGQDDWDCVIDTNLSANFHLAKRAAKSMLRLRRGRMVFVSSVVAMTGSPGQVNYAASKAGLIGMARSMARELGSRAITINVLAPGYVETDMTAELDEALKADYRSRIPLQRFAQPHEIAETAQWLASPGAAYVTGAVIPVDGGLGMGH